MKRIFLVFIAVFSIAISVFAEGQYVLVTGGAGYIGSQTCKFLSEAGFIPVTYDSLITGNQAVVKWGPFIQGDLSDKALLKSVIEKYHPIAAIHFAALISVGESTTHPSEYYWNNVVGTLNLLDVLREHQVGMVIFSSSAATYGISDAARIDESTPQKPINPYGNTKLVVEKMLNDFDKAYGMRYVSFRYFNAAGADLKAETGPNFKKAVNLIPVVIQAAVKMRPFLEVYGTDFPTPDGTGVRDYIHVVDLARAHVLALEYLLKGKESVTLNLGTGKSYSVQEVIDAARRIIPREIPVVYKGRRAGDPPIVISDCRLAKEVLGWEAEYSDIDTIIQSMWAWYEANH